MALILIEGFDTFASADNVAIAAEVARWYNISSVSDSHRSVTGRYGGFGLKYGTSSSGHWTYFVPPGRETHSTWYVGMAYYQPSGGWGTLYPFLRLGQVGSAGTGDGVNVIANSDGSLTVQDGNDASLVSTSANVITPGNWHYLELKAVCDTTNGQVELRINGSTVASANSVNTQTAGSNKWQRAVFSSAGNVIYGPYIDDMYICDGSGSTNNDFLGPCRVTTLAPTSDAGTNNGTPSSAVDHYTLIDENPYSESDYIELTSNGQKELYGYENLTQTFPVAGIQLGTMAREMTASGAKIKNVFKSGTTENTPNAVEVFGGDYGVGFADVSETNPDTSTAWTKTTVDGGTFGYELET